jgi:hypothetical protein
VKCTVTYAGARAKAARATWKLSRHKRAVAHGVAAIRHGRLAVDLTHASGVRRGNYVLTITVRRRHKPATTIRESVRIG